MTNDPTPTTTAPQWRVKVLKSGTVAVLPDLGVLLGDNKDAFEVAYEASGEKAIRVLNNAERSLRIAVEGLKEIAAKWTERAANVDSYDYTESTQDSWAKGVNEGADVAQRTLRDLGEA